MNIRRGAPIMPFFFLLLLAGLQVAVLLVLLSGVQLQFQDGTLVWLLPEREGGRETPGNPLKRQALRDFAERLESRGLLDDAAAAYETFLQGAGMEPLAPAIYSHLARAYLEREQPGKALTYFYKSEFTGADASTLKDALAGQELCLEKLGLAAVAETPEAAPGAPLLRMGETVLTFRDFRETLDGTPGSVAFPPDPILIREWVLTELLYREALRLGMHEDRALLRRRDGFHKNLLAGILLETKLGTAPSPTERELKEHYETYAETFADEDGVTPVPFDAIREAVKADYLARWKRDAMERLYQELTARQEVHFLATNLDS